MQARRDQRRWSPVVFGMNDDDDNETEAFDDDDTESVASVPVGAMKSLNLKAPEEDKKLPPHACAYVVR